MTRFRDEARAGNGYSSVANYLAVRAARLCLPDAGGTASTNRRTSGTRSESRCHASAMFQAASGSCQLPEAHAGQRISAAERGTSETPRPARTSDSTVNSSSASCTMRGANPAAAQTLST